MARLLLTTASKLTPAVDGIGIKGPVIQKRRCVITPKAQLAPMPARLTVERRPKFNAPPPVSLVTGASSHAADIPAPGRSSTARTPRRLARLPEVTAPIYLGWPWAGAILRELLRTM